jgi:hypothetical protein
MGWLRKTAHRLVDWAAEGIWQWIICYFLFTPGAWAGAVGFLRHYGVPMIPAIISGAVFASLAAIVITFFRRVHRLQGAIVSLQDVTQRSLLPSHGKENAESPGGGKGGILTTCSHCEFGFLVGASATTVACPKCGNTWRMVQYPRL